MIWYFHVFCLFEESESLVFHLIKILAYNKIAKITCVEMKKYSGKDYSQGVNVSLFVVSLFFHLLSLHLFRCHIRIGSSLVCKTNDNRFSIFDHDILGLYVPVNDIAFMDLANS
jgi:hypothetical protein